MLKKNPRWIELDADKGFLLRMLSTRQRDGALIAELNTVTTELAITPMMIDSKLLKGKNFNRLRSVKVAADRPPKADKPPKVWRPLTAKDLRPPRAMRNYTAVLTDANDIQWKLVISRVRGCPTHRHYERLVK